MQQIRAPKGETEALQQAQDTVALFGGQESHVARVDAIQCNPNGNGFPVAQAVLGDLLQFMRRPMAEIQRSRTAHFKRVAVGGNVVHVQLCTVINQPLHGRRFELRQGIGVGLDAIEKFSVANAGHLHGLHVAIALVAGGQSGKQLEIIDHRKWRRKGADEILFAKGIDPVFHAHARVILAECCGWDANVANTAMGRGGGQAHHVQQRAATHANEVGMAVDVVAVHLRLHFADVEVGILGAFAAFHHHWFTNQIQAVRMRFEISVYLREQGGLRLGQRFVHHDQRLARLALLAVHQRIAQRGILSIKHILREQHLMAPIHRNGALNPGRHGREPNAGLR